MLIRTAPVASAPFFYFNTSHVNVNPKGETGEQGPKGFQYISC